MKDFAVMLWGYKGGDIGVNGLDKFHISGI
jgi:hypothetical protein